MLTLSFHLIVACLGGSDDKSPNNNDLNRVKELSAKQHKVLKAFVDVYGPLNEKVLENLKQQNRLGRLTRNQLTRNQLTLSSDLFALKANLGQLETGMVLRDFNTTLVHSVRNTESLLLQADRSTSNSVLSDADKDTLKQAINRFVEDSKGASL